MPGTARKSTDRNHPSSPFQQHYSCKFLRSFDKMPLTLFRAKTKFYASLRKNEEPIIPPGQTCYPRTHERWINAPSAHTFGISLLPNGENLRELTIRHVYVFNQGVPIPKSLILYQTALNHYSLELARIMELDGMLRGLYFTRE